MTFDGSGAQSRSPVTFRGPAGHAIRQFLLAQRPLPRRNLRARILGRSPLADAAARWYWTATGQLDVMARLDHLGPEWSVVHGIPASPASDASAPGTIDHVVVGPAGVFIITAHNHHRENVVVTRQAFIVDGHHLQHIRQAEAAVGQVERMLEAATGRSVRASAIIAVIDPGSLQLRDLPRDVFVVTAAALIPWLKAREQALDESMVAELSALARTETTWSDAPPLTAFEAVVAARENAEFDHIRREVAAARIVRAAWAIGLIVVVAGALVALGILQLETSV
jgi:hypothetical protein